MPIPGCLDDGAQVGVLGLPVEVVVDRFAAGDEDIGIARAAVADCGGDGMAGDFTGGLDDFFNAVTTAVAQIILTTFPAI